MKHLKTRAALTDGGGAPGGHQPAAWAEQPTAHVALQGRLVGVRVGALPAPAYLHWLQHRVQAATAFASQEPQAPALWMSVVARLMNLLNADWRAGLLRGQRQAEACFARCDRTTMTQADIDSGKLVAHIGVAIVKPAEFTVLRIEQWTLNSRRP